MVALQEEGEEEAPVEHLLQQQPPLPAQASTALSPSGARAGS
jgi:hypothetical protein